MAPDTYLTLREAAELLKVHENTIRNWLKSGDLPGRQIGRLWRINAAAVEAMIPNTPPERKRKR